MLKFIYGIDSMMAPKKSNGMFKLVDGTSRTGAPSIISHD